VEFASVEEATAVKESEGVITMDGTILHINYATPKGLTKLLQNYISNMYTVGLGGI